MLKCLFGANGVVLIALAIPVLGGCRSANKTPPRMTPYAQGRYPLPQPHGSTQYAPQVATPMGAPTSDPGAWNAEQARLDYVQSAPSGPPGQYSQTSQAQTNWTSMPGPQDTVPFYSATASPELNLATPLFPFSGGTSHSCQNGCCNH